MKITKHSLDHIELVSSGDTALFEIRLVVAMHDWESEEANGGFDEIGALSWLMNLLHLASQGEDIKTGAEEFLKSMFGDGVNKLLLTYLRNKFPEVGIRGIGNSPPESLL